MSFTPELKKCKPHCAISESPKWYPALEDLELFRIEHQVLIPDEGFWPPAMTHLVMHDYDWHLDIGDLPDLDGFVSLELHMTSESTAASPYWPHHCTAVESWFRCILKLGVQGHDKANAQPEYPGEEPCLCMPLLLELRVAHYLTFAASIAWDVLESLSDLELEGMPALSREHVKLEGLPSLQCLTLKTMGESGSQGSSLICPVATLDNLTSRDVHVTGM